MSGRMEDFRNCYEPTWGRHRGRTHPVPGNHEYESGGSGYFSYFGASAGPSGLGYYSFSEGAWRVIALNSEVPSGAGSAQMAWLLSQLEAKPSACTAVIWHRPLFSSGRNGDNPDMRDVWRTLYEFNVDLVINGHDHTLDSASEHEVQAALAPLLKGRTSVIIAHRLSSIRNADFIVVLDAGRTVERGTHEQLLAQAGLYAWLWCAQARREPRHPISEHVSEVA